jgi:diguanylate cyclase (GGDEF)-like protein/PAS domain S-box-containing protein
MLRQLTAVMSTEQPGAIYDQALFANPSTVLEVVLEHIPQGIAVVGTDYRILAFNRVVEPLTGLAPGTYVIGGDFREVIKTWVQQTGQSEAMHRQVLAELDRQDPFEVQFSQQINGELCWIQLSHTPLTQDGPLPGGGFVRTFTDITEQKRSEARLLELSRTDSLTGLLNHQTFYQTALAEIQKALRYRRPLSLMVLDLDHFKQVNDQFGHLMGDQILATFAQTLIQSIRSGDLVGRVGGEEFAVLLPETQLLQTQEVAERILSMVRKLTLAAEGSHEVVHLSVSIGVAEYREPMTLEQFVSRADEAMYQAKLSGRDCYQIAGSL